MRLVFTDLVLNIGGSLSQVQQGDLVFWVGDDLICAGIFIVVEVNHRLDLLRILSAYGTDVEATPEECILIREE